eukprot:2975871-Pleurochrysis_carterae.AAC.1
MTDRALCERVTLKEFQSVRTVRVKYGLIARQRATRLERRKTTQKLPRFVYNEMCAADCRLVAARGGTDSRDI